LGLLLLAFFALFRGYGSETGALPKRQQQRRDRRVRRVGAVIAPTYRCITTHPSRPGDPARPPVKTTQIPAPRRVYAADGSSFSFGSFVRLAFFAFFSSTCPFWSKRPTLTSPPSPVLKVLRRPSHS
jgi:hypothetical protein